jgi:hypothetical protein
MVIFWIIPVALSFPAHAPTGGNFGPWASNQCYSTAFKLVNFACREGRITEKSRRGRSRKS